MICWLTCRFLIKTSADFIGISEGILKSGDAAVAVVTEGENYDGGGTCRGFTGVAADLVVTDHVKLSDEGERTDANGGGDRANEAACIVGFAGYQ